ncbi:hypothetical protein GCM10010331_40880 [Streptomyces xanthochromogenes]|nr:hypothetical protein GCM10010331_40880 [Streptomyces xanthochromogenes]
MQCPLAGNPCGSAPRPFRHLTASAGACPRTSQQRSRIPMVQQPARRVRHSSRSSESDRKNAAAALQRALDRRDNGGATGH